MDECATHADNCSDNATCTNTPGGFTCACEPGYSGNGVTCTARTGRVLVFADAAGTTTQPPAAAAAVSLDMTVTVALARSARPPQVPVAAPATVRPVA